MEKVADALKMVVPNSWLFSVVPKGISEHAKNVDALFWFLIFTCLILFLLIVVPMVLIVFRYRRKTKNQRAISQKDHNFWLESLWTFLPFIYLAILFVWGFKQFIDIYVAPNDAKNIHIIGQKWQWSADYIKEEINVAGSGVEIAVPVGKPIKLTMSSQDVIHSFFIPNLRIKQDVVPGRYTTMWFKADEVGEYPIFCAEYCGDLHSQMLAKLKVLPEDSFDSWVLDQKKADQAIPLEALGEKLYNKLGCIACHSIDASIKLAPSFKGVYGKKEELADGKFVTINDDYIKQKLLEPQKQTAKGFPPIMPTFQGRVSERDILGLIAYIKSLASP